LEEFRGKIWKIGEKVGGADGTCLFLMLIGGFSGEREKRAAPGKTATECIQQHGVSLLERPLSQMSFMAIGIEAEDVFPYLWTVSTT